MHIRGEGTQSYAEKFLKPLPSAGADIKELAGLTYSTVRPHCLAWRAGHRRPCADILLTGLWSVQAFKQRVLEGWRVLQQVRA